MTSRREIFDAQLRDLHVDIHSLSAKLHQSQPAGSGVAYAANGTGIGSHAQRGEPNNSFTGHASTSASANSASASSFISGTAATQGFSPAASFERRHSTAHDSGTGHLHHKDHLGHKDKESGGKEVFGMVGAGTGTGTESVAGIKKQLHTLTRERDEARAALAKANTEIHNLHRQLEDSSRLRTAHDHLRQDLDAMRISLESSERIRKQQKGLIALIQKSQSVLDANLSAIDIVSGSVDSRSVDSRSLDSRGASTLASQPTSTPDSVSRGTGGGANQLKHRARNASGGSSAEIGLSSGEGVKNAAYLPRPSAGGDSQFKPTQTRGRARGGQAGSSGGSATPSLAADNKSWLEAGQLAQARRERSNLGGGGGLDNVSVLSADDLSGVSGGRGKGRGRGNGKGKGKDKGRITYTAAGTVSGHRGTTHRGGDRRLSSVSADFNLLRRSSTAAAAAAAAATSSSSLHTSGGGMKGESTSLGSRQRAKAASSAARRRSSSNRSKSARALSASAINSEHALSSRAKVGLPPRPPRPPPMAGGYRGVSAKETSASRARINLSFTSTGSSSTAGEGLGRSARDERRACTFGVGH